MPTQPPPRSSASRRPFGFSNRSSVFEQRQNRIDDAKSRHATSNNKGSITCGDDSSENNSTAASGRGGSRNKKKRINVPPPRGERLRVVQAVKSARSVKPEREMSYQNSRPVMVGGMGQGTGLFAQPSLSRHGEPRSSQSSRSSVAVSENLNKSASTLTSVEVETLRNELLSFKVEHDAREQMQEILMKKISVLEREIEHEKLSKRQVELKARRAEDEVDRMNQQSVRMEEHGDQLEVQVEQLREDLAEERKVNEQKERQLLASAKALREAQQETYLAREEAVVKDDGMVQLLQEEKSRNAGLLRVIQERDGAIVALSAEKKALESKVEEMKVEIEQLNADLDAEREWRENAQAKVTEEKNQNKRLRTKIASLLDQLSKEEDHRATAIARAEAATKALKRLKQERDVDSNKDEDHEKKIKNLKDQVSLRERRVVLLRTQLEQEKSDHKVTHKRREVAENAYEGVRVTLKKVQTRCSHLEKLLVKKGKASKIFIEGDAAAGSREKKISASDDDVRVEEGNNQRHDGTSFGRESIADRPEVPIVQHFPESFDPSRLPGSDAPSWVQM